MAGFRYKVIPIEDWIRDPYYLGPDAESIYPYWIPKMVEYFHDSSRRNLILSGSARAGKTTIAAVALIRYIYEVGAFEHFPSLFGLAPSTVPKILCYSFTKGKATSQLIARALRIIDAAPFFQIPRFKRRPLSKSIVFPWVEVYPASRAKDALGEDMLGAILDEASTSNVAQTQALRDAQLKFLEARLRSVSTFSSHGRWAGFSILISTAGDSTAFVDQQIQTALRPDNEDTRVIMAAAYDVDPSRYSKERFDVFIGVDDIPPFIIDEVDDVVLAAINGMGLSLEQFLASHQNRIVSPPVSLRQFYREDIVYALQQASGVSLTSVENNLFRNPKVLDSLFDVKFRYPTNQYLRDPGLPYIGLYDDFEPREFFDMGEMMSHYAGEPVYGHVDLSEKYDRTGLALVFFNEREARIESLFVSSFYYDRTVPDNQISQDKVLDIILFLLGEGANIVYVSFDTHQSASIMQRLQLLYGSQFCGRLSVESPGPYLELLALAKRGRVKCYDYPLLRKELSQLVYSRVEGRIDHPHNATAAPSSAPTYSKDVADAFCGAVYSLRTHQECDFESADADARTAEALAKNTQEAVADDDFYSDIAGQGTASSPGIDVAGYEMAARDAAAALATPTRDVLGGLYSPVSPWGGFPFGPGGLF